MGLFNRTKTPRPRTSDCVFKGEAWPLVGEQIDISSVVVDVICDRPGLPTTWTGAVGLILLHSGEEPRQNVRDNVLGTLLAMVANDLNTIHSRLGPDQGANGALLVLMQGIDSVVAVKSHLGSSDAVDYFDFQLQKNLAFLAGKRALGARAERGYPTPDLSPVDPSNYSW